MKYRHRKSIKAEFPNRQLLMQQISQLPLSAFAGGEEDPDFLKKLCLLVAGFTNNDGLVGLDGQLIKVRIPKRLKHLITVQ